MCSFPGLWEAWQTQPFSFVPITSYSVTLNLLVTLPGIENAFKSLCLISKLRDENTGWSTSWRLKKEGARKSGKCKDPEAEAGSCLLGIIWSPFPTQAWTSEKWEAKLGQPHWGRGQGPGVTFLGSCSEDTTPEGKRQDMIWETTEEGISMVGVFDSQSAWFTELGYSSWRKLPVKGHCVWAEAEKSQYWAPIMLSLCACSLPGWAPTSVVWGLDSS